MKIDFRYSKELEADRIGYTLDKYKWYKENNYRINLPDTLKSKVELGESISEEEILEVVNREFDSTEYDNASKLLISEFSKIEEGFEKNLITLGGPVQDVYNVTITKYGVGGSYGLPNNIQVNIDYGRVVSAKTLAHEMVHLTIEDWIKEYSVHHWIKERIVDLTMARFFPGQTYIQGNPAEHAEVQVAFDKFFPDIRRVIESVAK